MREDCHHPVRDFGLSLLKHCKYGLPPEIRTLLRTHQGISLVESAISALEAFIFASPASVAMTCPRDPIHSVPRKTTMGRDLLSGA